MADKLENHQSSEADSTVKNANISPDNLQSTNTNTADNLVKNEQSIPDNQLKNCGAAADNQQISPDSTADNTVEDNENVDNFARIPISEFLKKYSIGRDPLYARMRFLQITTYKIKNKAYLDAVQAAHMDALHEYIKANGRMEGYPIPEPSGLQESTSSQITLSSSSTVSSKNENNQNNDELEVEGIYSQEPEKDIAAIARRGAERAAALIIGEEAITNHLLQNPDQLPPDLKEQVERYQAQVAKSTKQRQEQYNPDFFANRAIAALTKK